MKITKELLEKIVPDWIVHEFEGQFELTRHSPAGEEIIVSLEGETLKEMGDYASSYYDDFDREDHAAMIYHAKHYGTEDQKRYFASAPEGLEELLEDAKAIDEMYYQVGKALRDAAEEYG